MCGVGYNHGHRCVLLLRVFLPCSTAPSSFASTVGVATWMTYCRMCIQSALDDSVHVHVTVSIHPRTNLVSASPTPGWCGVHGLQGMRQCINIHRVMTRQSRPDRTPSTPATPSPPSCIHHSNRRRILHERFKGEICLLIRIKLNVEMGHGFFSSFFHTRNVHRVQLTTKAQGARYQRAAVSASQM
jgi:hypothetical protein